MEEPFVDELQRQHPAADDLVELQGIAALGAPAVAGVAQRAHAVEQGVVRTFEGRLRQGSRRQTGASERGPERASIAVTFGILQARDDRELAANEGCVCSEHQLGAVLVGLDFHERDVAGT
jgi:hypothetical protein